MVKAIINFGVYVLLIFLCSVPVRAEDAYFSVGGGLFELQDSDIPKDASVVALTARLGTQFNKNFSGEVRIAYGINDDSVSVPLLGNVDVELDSMYGVYLRGGLPLSDRLFPYGVIGYTRSEINVSIPGFGSVSGSESDASYGVGVDIGLGGDFLFTIEYMNYLDKGTAETNGVTLSLVKKF